MVVDSLELELDEDEEYPDGDIGGVWLRDLDFDRAW